MIQIQPKFIGGAEAHFVSAELNETTLEYKLYSNEFVKDEDGNDTDERVVIGSGSLTTDGTITNETALENVLSSLGVKSLAQIEAERIVEEERLAEQARIEAERQALEAQGQNE